MAGGSVVVKFVGDVTGLKEPIDKAQESLGGMHDKLSGVGTKIAGVGAAATGMGALMVEMGEKVERSHVDLETAVKNTGASYEEFAGQVNKAVGQQEHFGHSSGDTQEALAVLTRATGNTSQSLKDMALVTELAAAHHTSLAEAANTVAKMHAGAFRSLKEFGINIKDNASAVAELNKAQNEANKTDDARSAAMRKLQDLEEVQHSKAKLTVADHIALRNAQMAATDADLKNEAAQKRLEEASKSGAKAMDFNTASALVMAKVHGTAEAQADTFGGKIQALRTHFEDMAASLGTKVGPALTIAGPLLAGLGGIVEAGVVPAFASMAVSVGAAILPFVAIAAAIAALAAGVIYAYTQFQVFHDTVDAVASFFKDTVWPIIQQVAGTIRDAVVAMVDGIRDHWGQIMEIVRPVLDAVKTYVTTVMNVIKDVIALVMAVIHGDWGKAWDAIKQLASDVWDGIKGLVGDGIKLITTILKDAIPLLVDAGKNLLHGLWNGLKDAWHDVENFFHDLPGNILHVLGDVGKWLFGTGKKLLQGFIDDCKIALPIIADWFVDLPNKIRDAVTGAFGKLFDLGKTIVQKIIDGITSIGGGIGKAILDHVPGGSVVGGALHDIHVPGFALGGVVPGAIGAPMLAVVHGGETVVPNSQSRAASDVTVNNYFTGVDETAQARAIVLQLRGS